MSDQEKREDPQFETNSVGDLEELLARATNFADRYCSDTIAAELADGRDFVREELQDDEPELVTDGGQSETVLPHPSENVEFEYPKSQAFKLATQEDPDEYWYVKARVWNYDTDLDGGALPPAKFRKQYLIGEVSSLGGNARLVHEADLDQHYERVDKETAQEVI